MSSYAGLSIEELAAQAANNHADFDCFSWHAAPDDAEKWTIVYTSNRDSGLVDQSNAAAIEKEMAPFMEGADQDCVSESHGHWACGHVDGYAIRVYRADGSITPAFEHYCELMAALEDYPLLDESDHSEREWRAAVDYITGEGRRMVKDGAPDDWAAQVFSWLWDNMGRECENRDGTGAAPSEDAIREALWQLDMLDAEAAEEHYGEEANLPPTYWAVDANNETVARFAREYEAENFADRERRYSRGVSYEVRRVENSLYE